MNKAKLCHQMDSQAQLGNQNKNGAPDILHGGPCPPYSQLRRSRQATQV